ncbi:MAG: serine hydrolase domain-containing protein, partial [Bacteroidota bacterium]
QIIFSKAYGLASLEYLVPNTMGTIYNTASVSKQFSAMGIVRLEEQGQLSVDDDIRKHVPELPDFGETITIRHMLHHTSGLRSLHALLGLAGWRGDDTRTNEDLHRLLLRQTDLNFKPGDEYLYCNTGYMLMATIIENVTGEAFTDWMRANVFLPIGMVDTYVEDKYNRVVANNATSYDLDGNQFIREVEYWGYVGSGNMHSTTADLLRWLQGFHTPPAGWEKAFERMQTLDPFNDGTPNNYAFGVSISNHLGRKRVGHGGSIGGFRSNIGTYPDEKLNIVVLTNFAQGNPGGKLSAIAEILMEDLSEEVDNEKYKTKKLSTEELEPYEGQFWNDRSKLARKLYVRNDTLRYARSQFNESPLVPIGDDAFRMAETPSKVVLRFDLSANPRTITFLEGEASPVLMQELPATEESEAELESYVGTYYGPELGVDYSIHQVDGKLKAYHTRHGWIPLKREAKDVLIGSYPVNVLQIRRDDSGDIQGLMVTNGRVRNMWFERR